MIKKIPNDKEDIANIVSSLNSNKASDPNSINVIPSKK